MARAEYLKEQIKVGMSEPHWAVGCGFLLSVVVCAPRLPTLTDSALALALLFIPQIRESHWEAESLDKEGLSESVRSCKSCPGV